MWLKQNLSLIPVIIYHHLVREYLRDREVKDEDSVRKMLDYVHAWDYSKPCHVKANTGDGMMLTRNVPTVLTCIPRALARFYFLDMMLCAWHMIHQIKYESKFSTYDLIRVSTPETNRYYINYQNYMQRLVLPSLEIFGGNPNYDTSLGRRQRLVRQRAILEGCFEMIKSSYEFMSLSKLIEKWEPTETEMQGTLSNVIAQDPWREFTRELSQHDRLIEDWMHAR